MIIKLERITIHVTDSCKFISASRHNEFNNYICQEKDIGSNVGDFKKRLSDAIRFHSSDPKASLNAINNAYILASSIGEKISFNNRAFAILVDKYVIEGKEYIPTYDDDGLDETIHKISEYGMNQEILDNSVIEVKKKSNANWPFSFPETTE